MSYAPVPVESFGGLNLDADPGNVGWSGAIDICDVSLDREGLLRERDRFVALVANTTLNSPKLISWPGVGVLACTGLVINLYNSSGTFVAASAPVGSYDYDSGQPFGTPAATYLYLSRSGGTRIQRLDDGGTLTTPASMPVASLLGRTALDNRLVAASTTDSAHRVRFSAAGDGETWGETAKAVTGVAGTGVFTSVGHGYSVGDAVHFVITAGGSGLTGGRLYFVATTPTADTFTVATVAGGSSITFSTNLTGGTVARDNNYVDLDPGDGDYIVAVATYGDSLYVFKNTKYFVFHATSEDSTGKPVFNYTPYRNGIGANARGVAVAEDGLYVLSHSGRRPGIYRVVGGSTTLVSAQIRRALDGTAPATFSPGSTTSTGILTCVGERLFLQVHSGGGSYYLWVYEMRGRAWSLWQLPVNTAAICPSGSLAPTLLVADALTNAAIHTLDPTSSASDSLRTPTPLYRSGFSDLGTTQRKRVREWILEGSGTPTLKTSVDFGSLETGAAVTLGTSPAVAEGRRRYATRGRQFSWQVSASGAFSINNLVAHVDEKRVPGVHA